MYSSSGKRLLKLVTVSFPITLGCLLLAFVLMLASFEADVWLPELLTDPETGEVSSDLLSSILLYLPSIAYSLSIIFFNKNY